MVRLLYIEDESEIGDWVTKDLTDRGYEVKWLRNAEEAWASPRKAMYFD